MSDDKPVLGLIEYLGRAMAPVWKRYGVDDLVVDGDGRRLCPYHNVPLEDLSWERGQGISFVCVETRPNGDTMTQEHGQLKRVDVDGVGVWVPAEA